MKQFVARTISEVLYCLGDLVSRPMLARNWVWIYPVYNWLMDSSHQVQVWAGTNGPWSLDSIKDKE
jgi:hypothetical protein